MIDNQRIKELVSFLKESKRIRNQQDFVERIGSDKSTVSQILSGKLSVPNNMFEKICNAFPGISQSWLLTGEGNMLKEGNNAALQKDIVEKGGSNYKLVPLVHIDSVGGMRSGNSITGEPQYIEGYIPFVNAREGDIAIFQSGTSMIPTIPPGSVMQLRKVENWREYFGYGNIFVIELTDGRRITKEVQRYAENPREYVLCVSHNPDVAPEELPKSMIVSVWKVIKILTDKGW